MRLRSGPSTQRRGGFGAVNSTPIRPAANEGFNPPPAGPAGGAATAPPAAPDRPWERDPAWQQQTGAIDQRVQTTVSGLEGGRARYLQDAGYTATPTKYDQYGNPIDWNLAFDPTNVFSRAALLLKSYRQNKAGNTNSMAAQGQLNSGAYGRQQRLVDFNNMSAQNNLSNAVIDFLARNSGDIASAKTQGAFDKGTATGDAITRLQNAPVDPIAGPDSAPRTDAQGRVITARDPHSNEPSVTFGHDSHGRPGYWKRYPDGRTVFVPKK